MIPKSIEIKRVRKPATETEPIFKIPEILPPKKKKKVEEPEKQEETRPIEIEFIDYQQPTVIESKNDSMVQFTDIMSLDRRSKILENSIDIMSRNTAKLLVHAEVKQRKIKKLLKMMNVKVESEDDIISSIDVELPITTVDELNELNKRLMDDRIFYQKFVRIFFFYISFFLIKFFLLQFKYLNIYRTKGTSLLKILTKIVTAECISCYNWDGTFNKLGLKNLMLFSKFLKEYCMTHEMANDLTYVPEMRKAIHKCKNVVYKNQPL